jgi:hypothetical protein
VSLIISNLQVCVIKFCVTKPHSLILSEHISMCDIISGYGLGWFLVNIKVCVTMVYVTKPHSFVLCELLSFAN